MYQSKLSFCTRIFLSLIAFGMVSYIEYGFTLRALLMTAIFLGVAIPFTYLLERVFSNLVKKLP